MIDLKPNWRRASAHHRPGLPQDVPAYTCTHSGTRALPQKARATRGAKIGTIMTSTRWLIVAAAAVLLIVTASVTIGVLNVTERGFAPEAPEGTVQRHLRAVEDADAAAIHALMAPETQHLCDLSDIRNALRDSGDSRPPSHLPQDGGDRRWGTGARQSHGEQWRPLPQLIPP